MPSGLPFGRAVGLARPRCYYSPNGARLSGRQTQISREKPANNPNKKSGGIAPAAFILTDRVASIVQKPSPHRKYYLRAR